MLQTLTAPFPGTVLPSYDGRGISSIPASLLEAFGGHLDGHPPLSPQVLPPSLLEGVSTIVFILLDGLGLSLYERETERDPDMALATLARHGVQGALTSVLPSTTTAALATLSTGLTPQEHGLIGYKLYLREVGEIANMIRFSPATRATPYPRKRLNPQSFFDHVTLFQQLFDLGVTSRVIIRSQYGNSALSRMFYRGAEIVTHAGTHDAFVILRRILEQRDGSPSLVYLYWDPVDNVSHHCGPNAEEVAAEVQSLDWALRKYVLNKFKAKDVLFMITADHGHVHTVPARRRTFNGCARLLELLERPPFGDSRLPYLQAAEGRLDEVRGLVTQTFGDIATTVTAEEALRMGWFGIGDVHPEAYSRLGNLIVPVVNGWKLGYRYNKDEHESIGCHGGVDPEEMMVPFIAARLD